MAKPFLTLSFSGAGHLLPYHLGVASSINRVVQRQQQKKQGGASYEKLSSSPSRILPPIRAVAGSSSGAIAAATFSWMPHRIEEFADRFLSDGGRALDHLEALLHDEERSQMATQGKGANSDAPLHATMANRLGSKGSQVRRPSLHVATTCCSDGCLRVFDFRPFDPLFRSISSSWKTDELLTVIKASCRIPASFHPVDLLDSGGFSYFEKFGFSTSSPTYPDGDGVRIDRLWYVDGAISAPAPPTPLDSVDWATRVIISPISGSCDISNADGALTKNYRISPDDATRRFLPFELKLRGGLMVRPSTQNLQALRTSMGMSGKQELTDWYHRGQEDGENWIEMKFR